MKKNLQPVHICLFMACCLVMSGLVSLLMPKNFRVGDMAMRSPQLGEIFGLDSIGEQVEEDIVLLPEVQDNIEEQPVVTDSIIAADQLIAEVQPVAVEPILPVETPIVAETQATETVAEKPAEVTDTFDTHIFLSAFYQALQDTHNTSVRVIHYGDSQIEEDRLTTQVRRALQGEYGGGGVGLIPLHQTIGTRTLFQTTTMSGAVQSVNGGPKRYLVYGPKSYHRDGSVYGPMGQVAVMDNNKVSGSEDITLQVRSANKRKTETYFNRIRIWGKGDINVSVNTATEQQDNYFVLPDSTMSATIHLMGQGEVYGISLEADHGVMVDNIPMRGCSGGVFTGIASTELRHYFSETQTRLIILQFGGNVIPYTSSKQQVQNYVEKMRTQIQYLKYLAPNSSILFIGPSDMCRRKDGQMQTYPMIPVMDKALLQMTIEEEIGYFSLFQHMGGRGSMVQWKERGWAGGDYVHFTHKGADRAGTLLAEWIMNQQGQEER